MNNQIVYYLGSKLIAAVLNLLTMALFVRLGGVQTYGAYIIIVAWAYIVYGVTLQWLRFSFFACYRDDNAAKLIATYLRTQMMGLAGIAAAATALCLAGGLDLHFATGLVVLLAGLACYDAMTELARVRLRARDVAAGVMTRAILMLAFGTAALASDASPLALSLAVGMANLGAAFVLLLLGRPPGGSWSRDELRTMWSYGHPLLPAFALDSFGLQLDRLLLARNATFDVVGNYGAAADFIRQTMLVVAEAIAGAYVAVARSELVAGNVDAARSALGQAFLAYTALTAFAAAMLLRFDRLVFDALFGAQVGAAVEPLVPLIVASNVAGIFRAYYFGQALYLTKSTNVLLYSNAAHIAAVAATGLVLVPVYGPAGAAVAMLTGHILGCLVCVTAWRGQLVLELPYTKAACIVALAGTAYFATDLIENGLSHSAVAVVINAAVLAGAAVLAARLFNILSFNDISRRLLQVWRKDGTRHQPAPAGARPDPGSSDEPSSRP